jgi:hypothetical protein
MATPQGRTNMPYDRVRIVYERAVHGGIGLDARKLCGAIARIGGDENFLLRCHGRFDKGSHVEGLEGKVDWRTDFPGRFCARGRKALEMDHKSIRSARDCDLLDGFTVCFAAGAAPEFIACEALRRAVAAKAVADVAS